ncbi:MAG: hypothetical protein AAGE88_18245 [Actinomycetota bacterium]
MQVNVNFRQPVDLKNQGIAIRISDNTGKLQGTLQFGQATIEWKRAYAKKNVTKLQVEDLVEILNTLDDD